jgi:LacI family transcriptional regulator
LWTSSAEEILARGMGQILNIKSIAKRCDVSTATVSRVLNHPDAVAPETRARILAEIERTGYTPSSIARGLKLQKSGLIGLLMPELGDKNYTEIAKGIEEIANENDYNIMLCMTEGNRAREKNYLDRFVLQRVDGLIFAFSELQEGDIDAVKNKGIPAVFIGRNPDFPDENTVYTDYGEAVDLAMGHLAMIGHTDIAMVYGKRPAQENREKLKGYRDFLSARGLPCDEGRIVRAENSYEGGMVAATKLLRAPSLPTAVFVSSDTMAVGLMEKFKQSGVRIPDDVAVVGYDNLKISAYVKPKLTTIAKPSHRMGLMAARILFDFINGEAQDAVMPKRILIRSRLKVRKSCGHEGRLKEIF